MERFLRVNMTELKVQVEEASEKYRFYGGRSLIARLLTDEVDPRCEPLGPYNKIIFAPGLLGGTTAPCSYRLSVGAKSPLTGGIKESNGGGIAGGTIARLGYKGIIVEGLAEKNGPYILEVDETGGRLIPAPEYGGLGVYEATEKLIDRFGHRAIILIGPAGEMRLRASGVASTDKDGIPSRYAGRGGLGAVMGAKGLKAIVLAPGEMRKLYDKAGFQRAVRELVELLRKTPQTSEIYTKYGTAAALRVTNEVGGLPTRNFRAGSFEGADELDGYALYDVIRARGGVGTPTHACMPGCPIRCSNIFPDETGERVIVSPLEYETICLLGTNLDIGSFDEIAELNYLCNDYGLDTLDVGGALAICMDEGLIPWGDFQRVKEVLAEIPKGTMFGRVIGSGTEITGRVLGSRRIPAVLGQGMPAYEPRGFKGLGVTYATSPMGADHTAGNTLRVQIDHHRPEGQADASKAAQLGSVIWDFLGCCMFVGPAVGAKREYVVNLVNTALGWQWTEEDILNLCRETLRLERSFNRGAGIDPQSQRIPEFMYYERQETTGEIFDVSDKELSWVRDV
ncbi:MAG: aldehyde ferredoxin oxidoreductase C-terminal domain-containing protein [Limnochordia bacterium]|jgi:aldehyde:ferredoxin oxidoreductase